MSLNTILATAPLTTSGYHIKANGTTLGNSLIWDNGTNVGIGNTNTSYTLDVSGTGRFTGALFLGGSSGFPTVGLLNRTSDTTLYMVAAASGFTLTDSSLNTMYNATPTSHTFNISNAAKMTITSAGNVGIGTGSSVSAYGFFGVAGSVTISSLTGVVAGFSDAVNGTTRLYVQSGVNGINVDQNFVISTGGGVPTERMRITSGGNVLIGSSTDGSGKLQVTGSDNTIIANWKSTSGMIQFYPYYSTYGGSIIQSLNGSGASYAPLRFELTTMTVAGNQTVTGTKSFAIDHPLDNTKTLFHYSTESPKADLIYRGKANLINGKVEINIDISSKMTNGTFVALCRDIQCFTTNETGWDMVKGKVNGNILSIESNNQNSTDEISWMVIGERYDESIKNSNMLDEDGDLIVEKLKPSEPITN